MPANAGRTTQKTLCRICEAQCGLLVTTEDNRVVGIQPNRDHVASKGYACIKGLRMGDFAHNPDRLTTPLKKVDGEFVPIEWDQAIREIGTKLRDIRARHSGESIAAYMGNPIGFSLWPTTALTFFLRAFNAHKLFTPGTQDCANMLPGSVAVPHGWGHQNARGLSVARRTRGVNVNEIIPDGPESLEPLSGMSHMNGVVVQVSRAGKSSA